MNKKVTKILMFLVLFILFTCCIYTNVFAVKGSGIITENFGGNTTADTSSGEKMIKDVIGMILSVIRIVATGISVIMLSFLGIKYMSAAPSEKANIKNQLITFTIGAIVVVGTTVILDVLKDFSGQVFN